MSQARTAIRPRMFDPDRLRMLGRICDQVWASVLPELKDRSDQIEDTHFVWLR
jgi:hypothetical protein